MMQREQKFPVGIELLYTILFGLGYFLDLYVYIGYKTIFLEPKDGYFSEDQCKAFTSIETYSMLFLLVAFLFLVLYKRSYNVTISIRKMFWIGFLTQLLIAFLMPILIIFKSVNEPFCIVMISLFKVLGAVVVSLNLCAYLSIIGRNIGRKKRTWTVTLFFAIGFLGPFYTSVFKFLGCGDVVFCLPPVLIFFYAMYVFRTTKDNDIFSEKETNDIILNEDIKNILLRNNFWKSTFLLFLCGLPVQYSVRFLLTPSEDFFSITDIGLNEVFTMRYLGSCIGIVFFGFLSVYLSKKHIYFFGFRIRLGSRNIIYQIATAAAFLALVLFYRDVKQPYLIYLLIGVATSIWSIIFIQSLETFGRKTQPILVFLLPIFLRIFWDLFVKHEDLLRLVAYNITQITDNDKYRMREISLDIYLIILCIGFVVSIFWEDNYEGGNMLNAYDDNFSKGFQTSIMNKEIRDKISKIDKNIIRNENVEDYIKAISSLVEPRMKEVFDTALYYYSFTFEQNDRYNITDPVVNEASLKDLTKVSAESIRNFFKYVGKVLLNKKYIGFSGYSFIKGNEGIILAGDTSLITAKIQEEYSDNNYQLFDLSQIKIPKNEAQITTFWNSLHGIDFGKEGATDRTDKMFESIYDFIWKNTPRDAYEGARNIRRILSLRALGSWLYPKGEYYIYILTPQSGVPYNFKASLLLAMSKPIPITKLSEIRDMLDYILLEKAFASSLDAEWKKMAFQQSHALKTTLGNLKNKVYGLDEVREDTLVFEDRVKKKSTVIDMIDRVNSFNVELMRYENNHNKAAFLSPDLKGVDLNNTLVLIIDEIYNSMDSLRLTDRGHKVTLTALLEEMNQGSTFVAASIKLKIQDIALHILLLEIMKNAFVFTDTTDPQVHIHWQSDYSDEHCALMIANNKKMKKESLSYINDNENHNEVKKIGITTMRSIINFKRFNQSYLDHGEVGKWSIKIETEEKLTKFYLIIPKTDLYV